MTVTAKEAVIHISVYNSFPFPISPLHQTTVYATLLPLYLFLRPHLCCRLSQAA